MIQQILIPETKNYWLFRTKGGKYYNDFRGKGIIAINWDDIYLEDIKSLSQEDLVQKVGSLYPNSRGRARTANQLRIFSNFIKKGDYVIITGHSSNKLTIGEVQDDDPYEEFVDSKLLEENKRICPFVKRKRVQWLKQYQKYELDKNLFDLLQHAQHTISDANEYADTIEGLVKDYFVRGDEARIALHVGKAESVPSATFFSFGTEVVEIIKAFNEYSQKYKVDLDLVEIKVNVNSRGKMKFVGAMKNVTIIGVLLVGLSGGHLNVSLPIVGGNFEIETHSIIKEVSDFLDERQNRGIRDQLMQRYLEDLDVKNPDELILLINALNQNNVSGQTENTEHSDN